MVKKLIITVLLTAWLALPAAYAGEMVSGSENIGDIEQVLDRLKGNPGLYGASGPEMTTFIDMIQTPELASLVAKLSAELHAQGNAESMDLEQVSAFVRQNLTREDAERLLNQSVKPDEFQRAVQTGGQQQNLDLLVEMLRTK